MVSTARGATRQLRSVMTRYSSLAIAGFFLVASGCIDDPVAGDNENDSVNASDNGDVPGPHLSGFTANPSTAPAGGDVEFSWDADAPDGCEIDATGDGEADYEADECHGSNTWSYIYDEIGSYEATMTVFEDDREVEEVVTIEVVDADTPEIGANFEEHWVIQNSIAEPQEITDEFFVVGNEVTATDELTVTASSSDADVVADDAIDVVCDEDGECDISFDVPRPDALEFEVLLTVADAGGQTAGISLSVTVGPRLVTSDENTGDESLRYVIEQADAGDYIGFELGAEAIIDLFASIDIDRDLHIVGPGTKDLTLDGHHDSRIFTIPEDVDVDISAMTITRGEAPEEENGGAIYNEGHLVANQIVVDESIADGESGGAIYNDGILQLEEAVIADSEGSHGGGVFNRNVLTVDETTFDGNYAGATGGAIYQGTPRGETGGLEIDNSTFVANEARNHGGAIVNDDDEEKVVIAVANSTFVDNVVEKSGAAIMNLGPIELSFVTIVDNVVTDPDGDGGARGAGIRSSGPLELKSSIVVGNEAPEPADIDGSTDSDGADYITSHGYNVVGEFEGLDLESSDVDAAEIDIGALDDNGGATQTMLPEDGGPAIDLVDGDDCSVVGAGDGLTRDQRGEVRPGADGDDCDSGAVELQ